MRGDRLKQLREGSGLTQEELAIRISSSEPQIWRYEKNDAVPRSDVVVRLASFFNVTTDYLLGVSDELGTYFRDDLKVPERAAIEAWRHGDKVEAIKIIVGDE